MKVYLVLRKPSLEFNSIEKVFTTLYPYIEYELIVLPNSSNGWIKRIKNILFLLKYRNELIHISGHDHYLLTFSIFKKCILTIHDIEGMHRLSGWKNLVFRLFWIKFPIKNAMAVTTISNFVKNEILNLKLKNTHIKVIHNPLTLKMEFSPKPLSKNSKVRILQIGTKPNKNVERLIEALNGLNVVLVIVGKLSENQLKLLALNKLDYISLSNLSNKELIREYEKSDIITLVSTYEGFGLPIIEAQSIGRPVLTSRIASMPEVAGKGAMLIDPYSVVEIREGILKIIKDDNYREKIISLGKKNIEQYEIEIIAKEYARLYDLCER